MKHVVLYIFSLAILWLCYIFVFTTQSALISVYYFYSLEDLLNTAKELISSTLIIGTDRAQNGLVLSIPFLFLTKLMFSRFWLHRLTPFLLALIVLFIFIFILIAPGGDGLSILLDQNYYNRVGKWFILSTLSLLIYRFIILQIPALRNYWAPDRAGSRSRSTKLF